ncbi:MAG: Holliday junction resolvase RuvX [Minisyncoccia bacterium]
MKYMGIDFGSKRIGLAFSDLEGCLAFPHSIVKNTPGIVRTIAELAVAHHVETIVCGYSTGRDGIPNAIDADAKKFTTHLTELTGLPVVFEWEGYSSGLARSVASAGAPRGVIARKQQKSKNTHIDAHAAMVILQSYLDKLN